MSSILVAYFSASGVTAGVAKTLANAVQADLYEITPQVLYTAADLDWTDKKSRSTIEMQDLSCRPVIAGCLENMAQYDAVFIGFPNWWGREPSIVDTFIETYDFQGKKIIPFCTSGGSGVQQAQKRMGELLGAPTCKGKRLAASVSVEELKAWIKELDL